MLNQTFRDFEVLLLDDGSTDGSAAVLQEYIDPPRVRAFCDLRNSGRPFVQWNKGVALARGQYVWIAEADDFSAPEFLERMGGPPLFPGFTDASVCIMFWYIL